MKPGAVRRKVFFAIFSVLAIISLGTLSWAIPIGPWDFSVTVGSDHQTGPMLIGNELTFDSWWDIPNPSTAGEPWANVFVQRPDPIFGFVSLASYFINTPSSNWEPKVIDTSTYAGQTLNILFSITDYGAQDPDPIFYVRNLSNNVSVPEPSTMLLLGSGLVGIVGYGRRRMKK